MLWVPTGCLCGLSALRRAYEAAQGLQACAATPAVCAAWHFCVLQGAGAEAVHHLATDLVWIGLRASRGGLASVTSAWLHSTGKGVHGVCVRHELQGPARALVGAVLCRGAHLRTMEPTWLAQVVPTDCSDAGTARTCTDEPRTLSCPAQRILPTLCLPSF